MGMEVMVNGVEEAVHHIKLLQVSRKLCHLLLKKKNLSPVKRKQTRSNSGGRSCKETEERKEKRLALSRKCENKADEIKQGKEEKSKAEREDENYMPDTF